MNASRKFCVTESSIKQTLNFKYEKKNTSSLEPNTPDRKNKGKPSMLGDLNKDVLIYVKYKDIAMSIELLLRVAHEIVESQNRSTMVMLSFVKHGPSRFIRRIR